MKHNKAFLFKFILTTLLLLFLTYFCFIFLKKKISFGGVTNTDNILDGEETLVIRTKTG